MTIKSFTFGPFQTNTYVVSVSPQDGLSAERSVLCQRSGLYLIDPACYSEYERQVLQNYIDGLSGSLTILATHGHLDHLWGAKWATEHWHTPVLVHEADIPMVQAMQEQYDLFGIPAKAEAFEMKPLPINPSPFTVLHTPGHTPGSVCFYWPEEKVLLSGDTLFCMGFGRTDLPGGNYGQLMRSLDTLLDLPDDVRVYAGHGESTTIGAEKRGY